MAKQASTLSKIKVDIPSDLTEQYIQRLLGLPKSVKTDYLHSEMLTKFVSRDTDPPEQRRARAIEKWLSTESRNEVTNERLIQTSPDFQIFRGVDYSDFMAFASGLVIQIIGEVPPEEALIGAFSGGASTSRLRTASHPAAKYVGKAHVTSRAREVWSELSDLIPIWLGEQADPLEIEEVCGNVLFTVPKKTDIDRVACKEPDLNMYVQKGIGNYFRKCLLRHRINLNDQSINRSLARLGSINNSLSTLDLSSASDSVSRELVFQLLPVFWHTLLDSVRSPVTVIDGVEHRNEMFSSMGNGFTFELETLVFYVLARTTAYFRGVPGVISVYGDDIICPRGISEDLTWVLNYFGFEVNTKKSFVEGPFRESCGGHYYNGFDITPFYIRKPLDNLIDVIHAANQLRQWAQFDSTKYRGISPYVEILNPEVEDLWLWLKSFVPDILWGGVDTSFKYQLVSSDTPRYRITEDTQKRGTGYGGYLHWLNATWERNSLNEAVETSRHSRGTGIYRIRKAFPSPVDRLLHHFYHEVM
jgi:hypothetical protein